MLTTGEHITTALRRGLNVGSDDVAYDVQLRAQARYCLQLLRQQVWSISPLWWRQADATVTILANASSGACPSDFNNFGTEGRVWLPDLRRPLSYVSPSEIDALRQVNPSLRQDPTHYTLKSQTALGIRNLDVYPTPSRNITLDLLNYAKKLSPLIDVPTAPGVAPGVAGNLTGAYQYAVTFVHGDILAPSETEGGFVSAVVNPVSQKVDLSDIAVSPEREVWDRYLYRTVANNPDALWFVQALGDNTTTTIIGENLPDVDLGTQMPPPALAVTGMEEFPEDFHELVFTEGLVQMLRANVKSVPFEMYSEGWRANIRRMWADQRPDRHITHAMPAYGMQPGGRRRVRLLT